MCGCIISSTMLQLHILMADTVDSEQIFPNLEVIPSSGSAICNLIRKATIAEYYFIAHHPRETFNKYCILGSVSSI